MSESIYGEVDFENGLARLKGSDVIHLIDPDPTTLAIYCHANDRSTGTKGNYLGVPSFGSSVTCRRCIAKQDKARATKEATA
jgi:hypothetical protein